MRHLDSPVVYTQAAFDVLGMSKVHGKGLWTFHLTGAINSVQFFTDREDTWLVGARCEQVCRDILL